MQVLITTWISWCSKISLFLRTSCVWDVSLTILNSSGSLRIQVKDKNEYKFEPAKIVRKICAIYVHLGSSDVFCAAVSRDGRSYSPQLFEQAAAVLGIRFIIFYRYFLKRRWKQNRKKFIFSQFFKFKFKFWHESKTFFWSFPNFLKVVLKYLWWNFSNILSTTLLCFFTIFKKIFVK